MAKIKILSPTQSVNISSEKVHQHIFKGQNLLNQTVLVSKTSASCSCTSILIPESISPLEEFEIKMSVNKLNQSGRYSVYLTLDFEGETHTLRLSGEVV